MIRIILRYGVAPFPYNQRHVVATVIYKHTLNNLTRFVPYDGCAVNLPHVTKGAWSRVLAFAFLNLYSFLTLIGTKAT